MIAFLVRRFGQALVVMFVISLISFSIQDNLGDPLRELLGQSVSEVERQILNLEWQKRALELALWKDTHELRSNLVEERREQDSTRRRIDYLVGGEYAGP